jgi:hypothetical protein
MNICVCRRIVMLLHVCAMFLELGIVGVTLASLLSELRDEQVAGDHRLQGHHREIVMTSTSLALTITTFGITLLGAGDTVTGLKLAVKRISAAGIAVASRVSGSSSCVKSHIHTSERNDWSGVHDLNQSTGQAASSCFGEHGVRDGS